MHQVLSVVLPASNESGYLGACLSALFASQPVPGGAEVIVVANGCHDDTAGVARAAADQAASAGWALTVIELAEGGKTRALNKGDEAARGEIRAYLDADVCVSPPLMAQIVGALSVTAPRYASGLAVIPPARSAVTRAYARFWQKLPFQQSTAPGYGLFAVNAAGRARWAAFPDIISDDTFVRLHFRPAERIGCPASYSWPMVEGFAALVRVRKRQNLGVEEIAAGFPALMANEGKPALGAKRLAAMALSDLPGFAAYAAVSLAVKFSRGTGGWARGR